MEYVLAAVVVVIVTTRATIAQLRAGTGVVKPAGKPKRAPDRPGKKPAAKKR